MGGIDRRLDNIRAARSSLCTRNGKMGAIVDGGNEDDRTINTKNKIDGSIYGSSVQTESIDGGVHISINQPNPEQPANPPGHPRRYSHYFDAGCHLGNRPGMFPLLEQGASEHEEFLAAARRTGLSSLELSALAESGKELAQLRDSEIDTRSLVMRHVELINTVDYQLESQAGQDELLWFTFGKLIYRALQFRVLATKLTETAGGDIAKREAARTCAEARADLEKLAQASTIATTMKGELNSFLVEFDSPDSLESLWEAGQELARHCQRMLTLASAMGQPS